MLFGRKKPSQSTSPNQPVQRVTTILGPGINWKGDLRGKGGVRIEGSLEGEIAVRGLVIIGETGRVNCENFMADTVIVAGIVNAQIKTQKLEIRSTGRVYGDVTVQSFSTEEGAFLRGQVTMEEEVTLSELDSMPEESSDETPAEGQAS